MIIEIRDKHELKTCGLLADNIYEVDKLKVSENYQLFYWNAFKENDAPHHKEVSKKKKKIIEYDGDVPSALVVISSYLREKNVT